MASKVIAVAGAGTGISLAVAERFGKEGFKVALLARTKSRLETLVEGLKEKGIEAEAFAVDLGHFSAVKETFDAIKEKLGPVSVLHWNAYAGVLTSLLDLTEEKLDTLHSTNFKGLIAAVQAAVPQLEGQEGAAVLITNGIFYKFDAGIDTFVQSLNAAPLAYAAAAKHKISSLLNLELSAKGIFAGELSVNGTVKGTAWDQGDSTLESSSIAEKFWEIYTARAPVYSDIQ